MSGFIKKIWKDRVTEFPTRRSLTKQDGSVELVTVAREEGTVSQEGDAFSAQNMNDLEERVKTAFDAVDSSLNGKVSNFASGNYKAVTGLAYDPTNKKLGLKVGADTVIPFNGGKTVVSGFYNRNNVSTVMYIPLKGNESVTTIACDYNSNGSTSNGLTMVIPSNKDSFKLTLKNETTSAIEILAVAQTNDSGSYVPIKDNNVRVTIPSKSSISFNSDDYPTMIGFSLYWYTGFDKGISVIIE